MPRFRRNRPLSNFDRIERFRRYHGLKPYRPGRIIGGPINRGIIDHPERVRVVRGRRIER